MDVYSYNIRIFIHYVLSTDRSNLVYQRRWNKHHIQLYLRNQALEQENITFSTAFHY